MPCDDISEILELRLDPEERLQTYALFKRTCGAEIGRRDLLLDWLATASATTILGLSGEALFARYTVPDAEEFLYAKHLVALQEGLATLLGRRPGRPDDPCAVIEVAYDEGWQLRAALRIDALTDAIRACGNCRSCSRRQV